MKFKKLTIHNIASIEDAVIDFNHGPLAEDSRFLICGPTGSGKTTLLDAICLVLYGTTPRLYNTKSEGYVDPNENFTLSARRDDIKIDDTRMLMRRGSLSAWVELIFTDKDDYTLKAVWNCSRARNKIDGSIKVPEWSVLNADDDTVLCAKKSEIPSFIEERIGLTFEQFCRTTLLAQGDFTKFLKSGENEKSDILEKLTGTAIYSEISKCIHLIKGEKDAICQQIKSKLRGVELLNTEEVEAVHFQLEEVGKRIAELTDADSAITAALQWHTQFEKLKLEVEQTRVAYATQCNKMSDENVKQAELLLFDWDRTFTQRDAWTIRSQANEILLSKRKEESDLKVEYLTLMSGLLFLKQEEQKTTQAKLKVDSYLINEAPKVECYRQMGLIDSLIQRRSQTLALNGELESSMHSKHKELALLVDVLQEQNKQSDALSINIQVKDKELSTLSEQLDSLNYESLLNERQEVISLVTGLNEYRLLEEQCSQAHLLVVEKSKAYHKVVDAITLFTCQVQDGEKDLKELEVRIAAQEEIYKLQERSCSDIMREYRKGLAEGDVCPLCGQRVLHLVTDAHFVSLLQPVKDALEKLWMQQKEFEKNVTETKAQLSTAQRDLSQKKREWLLAEQQEDRLQCQRKSHTLYPRFELEEDPATAISDALSAAKQRDLRLERQLQVVGSYQKQKEILHQERAVLEKSLNSVTNEIKESEKRQSRIHEGLISDLRMSEQYHQSLNDVEKTLSQYIDLSLYKSQGDTYLDMLHKGAQYYQMAQEKQRRVDAHLQTLVSDINHSTQALASVLNVHANWEEQVVDQAVNIEQLPTKWVELQSKVLVINDNIMQASHQWETADSLLCAYFSEHNSVSESRLEQLASLPVEQVESVRKSLQNLHELSLRLKTEMESAEKSLVKHRNSQSEVDSSLSVEDLKKRQLHLKECLSAANRQMGKLSQTLEADKQNRIRFESITTELNAATLEAEQWSHLHALFGSSDGKKFRNIAQSYVLEQLLVNANHYLLQFTERYEMICQPGSLTILLRDKEAGGVLRPTSTISGGESFLISLSLALGLSSLSRASFSMDTLFIDEGFGTLDSSYLSSVMDALERLHQMGGKRIGIISHVESLKERLTTQIQVSRINNTLSKVSVVSLL